MNEEDYPVYEDDEPIICRLCPHPDKCDPTECPYWRQEMTERQERERQRDAD